MKKLLLLLVITICSMNTYAQVGKMIGDWNTVDDRTGDIRSRVNIYQEKDGYYYGKIVAIYVKDEQGRLVDMNPPYEGVIGMKVLKKMSVKGSDLSGSAYDPESQKTYYGKISYDAKNDQLELRGSIDKWGVLGRSQTWIRSNP